MAAVDPYSPCPCGSGQKFKWCCHKVEAQADRAQKLMESGQTEAAFEAIAEGLRKDPGNAWLLTRKALFQIRLGQIEPAKESLRRVLERQPKHFGAHALLTRLVLETEGPNVGAGLFQQVLTAFPPEDRAKLASVARVVGAALGEAGRYTAALKHLELARRLAGTDAEDPALAGMVRTIERSPAISPWRKNPYRLSPPPAGLADWARERFEQALRRAEEGLWAPAASAFDALAADPHAGAAPEAVRNLGLCRLWLADDAGAVEALRRYIARAGETAEAVDLEALCQQVAPLRPDDVAERVQLIWPLHDRDGLLRALRADKAVQEEGQGPIDDDDPDSPVVDQFGLLDRPAVERSTGLHAAEVPTFLGRVLVGQEIVALESYDDGRLDALSDRFTALAGRTIPPAHPRTKVLGKVARATLALSWEWLLPADLEQAEVERLNVEQETRLLTEIWPATPLPALRGRTPLQAAAAGDARIALRAAVFQLEQTRATWRKAEVDFAALRARLHIEPEPPIDPETVDLDQLHLVRLVLVPVERLDDDRLVALYRRARRYMLAAVLERAARVLIERPSARERGRIDSIIVYLDLATIAGEEGRTAEALGWVARGRQADAPAQRVKNAPVWDMLEIRLRAQSEAPEVWVPDLAVVLERYREAPDANQTILMSLIDMGLVEILPNPDQPGDILMDSRPLQYLLAEYGPRVTTSSGVLGVSATRGDLWTPGGPAAAGGGAGGIWTPGSDAGPAAPGEGKPKLIIPGR